MFSMHDGPLTHQSTSPSLTVQMSAQSGWFQVTQAPTTTRKINFFALWMEAWNVYASTLLSAKPSHAFELFGYQCLITSANIQLPLSAWMTYDVKFRTLAVNNPLLRWDACHPDLWLECLTSKPAAPEHWPFPHYNGVHHFPDCCPFRGGKSPVSSANDRQPFSLGSPPTPRSASQPTDHPS